MLVGPIWLEHLSRDIQRLISQLANVVARQASRCQGQNWLIWRHYPAGKRSVPRQMFGRRCVALRLRHSQ